MDKTIAFFGAGNLAEAIIAGITRTNVVTKEQVLVANRSDKARLDLIAEKYGVTCKRSKEEMVQEADIIILAMKPKDAGDYLNWLKDYIKPHHIVISVIAGLSIEQMEKTLGEDIPVIRTMPNTSALIGQSATAISKGSNVEPSQLYLAEELFQTVGTTKIVDEAHMHTITAIAGSGPAFFYYMVEAMENAAVEAGLDRDTALELLTQTVIGAGKMLESSGEDPEQLRINITSPSGTTEAGLNQLMENGFDKVIKACVEGARKRSVEITNGQK
ncbi:pyrroline-5-carboxylate reductase [Oceanobacillus jeddahense]|uniref:Pyrroline-5-carboxylate reductase n=1 Tax=Oceanobacillus jeddahense TaxID=1462527 RepID=A0ABY5JVJ1_9BACI|nr:pyrroline-5-carboxylate reductase [Oceanobacillus jeddahense]UUI03173.1 pyrroline-5-carboxylate reductase [Oceanobacillus jeddahense]